jgi:hypothetical protein
MHRPEINQMSIFSVIGVFMYSSSLSSDTLISMGASYEHTMMKQMLGVGYYFRLSLASSCESCDPCLIPIGSVSLHFSIFFVCRQHGGSFGCFRFYSSQSSTSKCRKQEIRMEAVSIDQLRLQLNFIIQKVAFFSKVIK